MEEKGVRVSKPWFSSYDAGVPETIDYPLVHLDQLLADSAGEYPEQRAIIFGGRVASQILDSAISYRRLDDLVSRFAGSLRRLGVRQGDRVAIIMPNCPQFVIAFYGILRAGGIAVPCNFVYTASELEHHLADAGAEIACVLSPYYPKVHSIRASAGLRHLVVANVKEHFPSVLRLLFTLAKEKKGGHRVELASPDDLFFPSLLEGPPLAPSPAQRDPQDTACLLYTGGTTGVPKGAQLTHMNLVSNAVAGLAWSQLQKGHDITIGALPLFHSYGMTSVMNVAVAGALTMVLIPDPRDILHIMGSISKHKATFYPAVPTMYVSINNHPRVKDFELGSIRACLSGAAPLPKEVQTSFQDLTGCTLVEAYGLTETSPATHVNPLNRNKIGFIGIPWPDTDARIVDVDTGEEEQATGEIGELIIQGPQVMKGYWAQPTETANVLREHPQFGPGLWLHTGDIARMDDEGYFQIVDRKKDMIICGGYNVYPRDVEEALFKHPAVKEAAVVGIPDKYRGETVVAFVTLAEDTSVTEDELISFCREHLASYKVPSSIRFRSDLPKSMVGKVLRRELARELAESG